MNKGKITVNIKDINASAPYGESMSAILFRCWYAKKQLLDFMNDRKGS